MRSSVKKIIGAYNRGEISKGAFVGMVFQHIDETTLQAFLRACPPEMMTNFKTVVEASPTTESAWEKVKFVEHQSGTDLTPEETEKALDILRARYRKGVETLRKYFASR